ncbi:hypothetical protein HDV00_011665 [Rhizophlyctis rosea]|nr:hypothetical protein HDV00_011665 [Rhizophlyctis rosea]
MSSRPLRQTISRTLRSPLPYIALGTGTAIFWYYQISLSINAQKWSSGIFKAAMFHIRHHPDATSLLGTNIRYNPETHPKVDGKVNMLKGNADLTWRVEGSKDYGTVRYRGRRGIGERDEDGYTIANDWHSEIFTLETSKGAKLSLRDEEPRYAI